MNLEDCIKGRLYKFNARNFYFGVYDGQSGFIGIRSKWGERFLDTEIYQDDGNGKYGTVSRIQDTGQNLPTEIQAIESLGSIDEITQRSVEFDHPIDEGGKGWYFLDTGEPCPPKVRLMRQGNPKLFDWLDQYKDL